MACNALKKAQTQILRNPVRLHSHKFSGRGWNSKTGFAASIVWVSESVMLAREDPERHGVRRSDARGHQITVISLQQGMTGQWEGTSIPGSKKQG